MIYVFLADGFEEIEAITAIDLLKRCDLNVISVGIGKRNIKGSHNITVTADITSNEIVLNSELQMIVLPGGMPGTLNLEKSQKVQQALDFCYKNNKYIAAICAAPSILGHKGILKGKKAVCYTGFESQLVGAKIIDASVCIDGSIITSRGAGTAIEFALCLVKELISEDRSRILADSIIY